MDQQPPNARPESGGAGVAAARGLTQAARRPARRYPKPPPFFSRIILLCVRPEFWAQSARYPTYITLLPLLVVIILGAIAATTGQSYRQATRLWAFAERYDKYYPTMELSSEGTLRAVGTMDSPVRVPLGSKVVLVDPTGGTNPQTVSWDDASVLVTDKYLYTYNEYESLKDGMVTVDRQPLTNWLAPLKATGHYPEAGKVKVVNGSTLREFMGGMMPTLIMGSVAWMLVQAIGVAMWVALMVFLLSPVIMQVAAIRGEGEHAKRGLMLPRRAAVRMAAGFMVPLVALELGLRAAGIGGASMMGSIFGPFFGGMNMQMVFTVQVLWLAAGAGLAIWTGLLARRMYAAPQTTRS